MNSPAHEKAVVPAVNGGSASANTAEEEKRRMVEFDRTVREHALRGGVIGLCLGTAGIMVASRFSSVVRNLTIPFKCFIVSSVTTACLVIEGEKATFLTPVSRYHQYQQLQDQGDAATATLRRQHDLAAGEPPVPLMDRAREWAIANRMHLTAGIWAAAMGTSFFMLYRNPHLNVGQKIVQARVYAQAAVLASLLATAGLTSLRPAKGKEAIAVQPYLYPWEEEEQKALKVPVVAAPTPTSA